MLKHTRPPVKKLWAELSELAEIAGSGCSSQEVSQLAAYLGKLGRLHYGIINRIYRSGQRNDRVFTRVARSGRCNFYGFREIHALPLYRGRELDDVWSHGGRCRLRFSWRKEGRKEEPNSRKGRRERERESFNSLDTLSIIGIRNLEVMSICIFKKSIFEEF